MNEWILSIFNFFQTSSSFSTYVFNINIILLTDVLNFKFTIHFILLIIFQRPFQV